jgi:hypothetical protein
VVAAGWVDRDTDPVARDPGSAWAVAEDQAAGELAVAAELVVVEQEGVAALGHRGAAELVGPVVPAYGDLVVRRAAEVAPAQVPVARVAEAEQVGEVDQVAGLDQEPAAEVVV